MQGLCVADALTVDALPRTNVLPTVALHSSSDSGWA